MQCNRVREQLNVLIDGELSRWRAWQVTRHLGRCAACAAECEEIQRLSDQARAWRNVRAPAALQARIAAAISVAPGFSGQKDSLTTVHWSTRWRPIAALVGIAALLGVLAFLVIGPPGRPTIAFADVVREMKEIKTARWIETNTDFYDPNTGFYDKGKPIFQIDNETWVRLNPPAYASRILPTTARGTHGISMHDTRYVIDHRGQVVYNATENKYMVIPKVIPRGVEPNRFVRAFILDHILSPGGSGKRELQDEFDLRVEGQTSAWKSQRVTLNGQPAIQFQREYVDGSVHLVTTVWADPETHRVIRSECKQTNRKTGHLEYLTVCHDFRYNETPSAGTFDLTPPSGARVEVLRQPDSKK